MVAIDPSSPITGGAVLGDRLRMETHLEGRPGVFVRSLASRGSHGAVAGATRNIARLLELSGLFDVIVIETVGAGQTEIAIVEVADTVVLVTVPGLGDAVQTIKAGLMEVADMFVVNMADRPGASETARHLRLAAGKVSNVLQTTATEGIGVDALREALDERWANLADGDALDELRAPEVGVGCGPDRRGVGRGDCQRTPPRHHRDHEAGRRRHSQRGITTMERMTGTSVDHDAEAARSQPGGADRSPPTTSESRRAARSTSLSPVRRSTTSTPRPT